MFSSMLSRGRVFLLALLVVAAVLVGVPSVGLAVVAEDVPVVDGGNPWNDDEYYIVAETPTWLTDSGNSWDDDEEHVSATAQPMISAPCLLGKYSDTTQTHMRSVLRVKRWRASCSSLTQ